MTYYGRGGNSYGSSRGSYGNNRGHGDGKERDRRGGNSLLDDLDSFVVDPIRPGPPVIKNFYSESSLITARPQHLTDQFYMQNEMSIRGFAPKPILAFDEVQFPSKSLCKLKFSIIIVIP
jgi:hypothetical protein